LALVVPLAIRNHGRSPVAQLLELTGGGVEGAGALEAEGAAEGPTLALGPTIP